MAELNRLHVPFKYRRTPPPGSSLFQENYAEHLVATLCSFQKTGFLCDYTIQAEDQTFKLHRTLLIASSDYFKVMLTGGLKEASQNCIELKGVTAAGVRELVNYIYTGNLNVSLDDISEILAGACHLQIPGAVQLCDVFLQSRIQFHTCIDIMNLADMFSLPDTLQAARQFLLNHFALVMNENSAQFGLLQKRHLVEVLNSQALNCDSELHLFKLLCRWLECSSPDKTNNAYDVFQHVRFSLMNPEELVDHVSKCELIVSDPRCRRLLDEALHYHVLPQRQGVLQNARSSVRNHPCVVAFGGRLGKSVGYDYNSSSMFALQNCKWIQLPDTICPFLYAAVAVVDNFMYICGGMGKPAHAQATCYRFDPRNITYVKIASMHVRRQSFPLVPYRGKLYALGGGYPQKGRGFAHDPTDRCEVYSIAEDTWRPITSLPGRRKSVSACEHKGCIYITGGRTDSDNADTFWCYDIADDSYHEKPKMPEPMAGHAMLSALDSIYLFDRNSGEVLTFSLDNEQWTRTNWPVFGPKVSGLARPVAVGTWVYCFSYCCGDEDYVCCRYNLLTKQLEKLPPFPVRAHGVIGAQLAFPKAMLIDQNNNP